MTPEQSKEILASYHAAAKLTFPNPVDLEDARKALVKAASKSQRDITNHTRALLLGHRMICAAVCIRWRGQFRMKDIAGALEVSYNYLGKCQPAIQVKKPLIEKAVEISQMI